VSRLVKAELATARQKDSRDQAPPRDTHGATFDTLPAEPSNLRPHVITHQIKLVLVVAVGRMAGDLGGWRGEYQPAFASVNRGKAQDVTKERTVRSDRSNR